MGYRFELDEEVEAAMSRVLHEQVDKALSAIDDEEPHEAVHEVRKRCKKCRAVVRLVRKVLPRYDEANAHFRDMARPLARLREATAYVETVDALLDRYEDGLDADAFAALREALVERRERVAEEEQLERRLDEARTRLLEAKRLADALSVEADGFAAVRGGLKKTLGRCVRRLEDARDDDDPDLFHEWRKRVKYHRYHLKLLRPAWPPMINARRQQAHALTDLLGDLNDLVELRATLRREPITDPSDDTSDVLEALILRHTRVLRQASRKQGERLLAGGTGFVDRVERWWRVA